MEKAFLKTPLFIATRTDSTSSTARAFIGMCGFCGDQPSVAMTAAAARNEMATGLVHPKGRLECFVKNALDVHRSHVQSGRNNIY